MRGGFLRSDSRMRAAWRVFAPRPPPLCPLSHLAFQGEGVPAGVFGSRAVLFQGAQEFNVGQRFAVVADAEEKKERGAAVSERAVLKGGGDGGRDKKEKASLPARARDGRGPGQGHWPCSQSRAGRPGVCVAGPEVAAQGRAAIGGGRNKTTPGPTRRPRVSRALSFARAGARARPTPDVVPPQGRADWDLLHRGGRVRANTILLLAKTQTHILMTAGRPLRKKKK